jgi:hypothetical protein
MPVGWIRDYDVAFVIFLGISLILLPPRSLFGALSPGCPSIPQFLNSSNSSNSGVSRHVQRTHLAAWPPGRVEPTVESSPVRYLTDSTSLAAIPDGGQDSIHTLLHHPLHPARLLVAAGSPRLSTCYKPIPLYSVDLGRPRNALLVFSWTSSLAGDSGRQLAALFPYLGHIGEDYTRPTRKGLDVGSLWGQRRHYISPPTRYLPGPRRWTAGVWLEHFKCHHFPGHPTSHPSRTRSPQRRAF